MKRIVTIAATTLAAISLMGSASAQHEEPIEFGTSTVSGTIGIHPGE